jgi:Na+-transporting methylmalonyl-CoA/oxaloacetate decarboxylase gamma subunit
MLFSELTLFKGFQMDIGEAFLRALIGQVTVFAVLGLLVGFLMLFKIVFKSKFFNKSAAVPLKEAVSLGESAENTADGDELIAVITAAVSAMYESESEAKPAPPFVIRNARPR